MYRGSSVGAIPTMRSSLMAQLSVLMRKYHLKYQGGGRGAAWAH